MYRHAYTNVALETLKACEKIQKPLFLQGGKIKFIQLLIWVIQLGDVQNMSVRQIVNFCNEKIDVMMEEAVVAMKSESAVQAHHATA